MKTHIYAFGSICRGEFDFNSDIDLLACVEDRANQYDVEKFSVYQYQRLIELWQEGNPFAWHLFHESKLIFSSDGNDFVKDLGSPMSYKKAKDDCERFLQLFIQSKNDLMDSKNSQVFNVSCIFLAIRNFATCYSLGKGIPIFSRYSAKLISPRLIIDERVFNTLLKARVLSTRGIGESISEQDIRSVKDSCSVIECWMLDLYKEICHE